MAAANSFSAIEAEPCFWVEHRPDHDAALALVGAAATGMSA